MMILAKFGIFKEEELWDQQLSWILQHQWELDLESYYFFFLDLVLFITGPQPTRYLLVQYFAQGYKNKQSYQQIHI